MKNQRKYKAFSLFEILISIIILGIVATAFPMILQSVHQSAKSIIKEKDILEEISLLKLILTYSFDENNTKGDNFYKEVNATEGDSELLIDYYSDYTDDARLGKYQFNNNKYRSGTSDTPSKIGIDDGEDKDDTTTYDDIDDFDGYTKDKFHVKVYYISDETDYSQETINFSFNYKTPSSNKTNIKVIKITSDNNITIYYPTCNIGLSKFLSFEELTR